MPEWTTQPPDEAQNYGYRLIRCPAFKPMRAIILSPSLMGTRTHYTKGRTLPCEPINCEACSAGHPWRWHAYLAVLAGDQKEKCILELTAQAAEQLQEIVKGYGTLRGIEILAERPSRRPNGRVRIVGHMNGSPPNSLPFAPDVKLLMLHIWGLDDRLLDPDPAKKPFDAKHLAAKIGDILPISDSAAT